MPCMGCDVSALWMPGASGLRVRLMILLLMDRLGGGRGCLASYLKKYMATFSGAWFLRREIGMFYQTMLMSSLILDRLELMTLRSKTHS